MEKVQRKYLGPLLSIFIMCLGVSHIAQAAPATYNFTFTASGTYQFSDMTFNISLAGDTDDINTYTYGTINEFLTGTFTGPYDVYNQVSSPSLWLGLQDAANPAQSLIFGNYDMEYLDLYAPAFSTSLAYYDLSTAIGPLTYDDYYGYSANLSSIFPGITFDDPGLDNITFEAITNDNDSSILYDFTFTASGAYEFNDKTFSISLTGDTDDIYTDGYITINEFLTGTFTGPYDVYNQVSSPSLWLGLQDAANPAQSLIFGENSLGYLDLYAPAFSTSLAYYDLSTAIGPLTYDDTYYGYSANLSSLFPDITFDDASLSNITFEAITTTAPVPEPATLLLLGSGLFGLMGFRKRFFKK